MVENAEHEAVNGEEEDVAVDDVEDEGDLDVVQPSEQWQTLKPGNALSVFLHRAFSLVLNNDNQS